MTNEIGVVSVRVRPDTTRFAPETKKALDRIEKQLKLTIRGEIDGRALKKSALEHVRALNAELKSNDHYAVKFKAAISPIGMKGEVNKAARELNALAKANQIKFRASVDNITPDNVLVYAKLDKASLITVNSQINAYIKTHSPKLVLIQPVLAPGKTVEVGRRLDLLARDRATSIFPEVNSGALATVASSLAAVSGLRLTGGIFREFREFFSTLDQKIPLISSLALAMAGLAGTTISASGSIFSLSRALAQIGPAALALPGIFGGISLGILASALALKDFNKEFPNFALSAKKGANGTKNIGQAFKDLQATVSTNFWDQARAPIERFLTTIFPQFAQGLESIAGPLGNFFGTLATALTGQLNGALAGMFKDLGSSIQIFTTHISSAATILRVLGETGAGRLPELAQYVGVVTDKLAAFLDQAQRTGKLDAWINRAVDRIKSLGDVLQQTYKLLSGLGKAADKATPGDALSNLAAGLKRAQEVVNSPAFQKQLTGVLMAANTMFQTISQTSGPAFRKFFDTLATTLQTVLPTAGKAIGTLSDGIYTLLGSTQVQNGIVDLFNGIAAGANALRPAFDALAPKLGAVLTLIGTMIASFGGVLNSAVQVLAPVATALAQALTPLVAQIGPIISKAFTDLGPLVAVVAQNITKLGTALGPLIAALGKLWQQLAPVLVPVLKLVVTILGNALVGAVQGLTLVITGISTIISGFVTVFQGFYNVIAGIINGLLHNDWSGIVTGLGQIFSGLLSILGGLFTAIGGAILTWLNVSVLGIFRGGILAILTAWRGGWSSVFNIVRSALGAVKGAITGSFSLIRSVISSAFSVIKGDVVAAWNFVRTIFSGAGVALRDTVAYAWNTMKAVIGAEFAGIKAIVSGAWDAIKTFFSGGISAVLARVRKLPSSIKGIFKGAATLLVAVGGNIVEGLKNGIENAAHKVVDAAKHLADSLPSWVKKVLGIHSPSRVMAELGRYSAEGLANGIKDNTGKVDAAAQRLGESIARVTTQSTTAAANASKAAEAKATQNRINSQIKSLRKSLYAWRDYGRDAAHAAQIGLTQNFNLIRGKLSSILSAMPKGLKEKTRKAIETTVAGLNQTIDDLSSATDALKSARDDIKNAAKDFANSAVTSLTDLGNPTNLAALGLENVTTSFDQIVKNYDAAIARAQEFSKVVGQLATLKLDPKILQQIIAAGPDAGYQTAIAIAQAGQAGVDQINQLGATLTNAANGIYDTAYNTAYQTGTDAAAGLIAGLQDNIASLTSSILEQMKTLGAQMSAGLSEGIKSGTAAIEDAATKTSKAAHKKTKKVNKIHSPSRVYREFGRFISQGFALGIIDGKSQVEQAVQGVTTPNTNALNLGSVAGRSAAAGTSKTFIYNAASGGSSLSAEEELFAALTRARSTGF